MQIEIRNWSVVHPLGRQGHPLGRRGQDGQVQRGQAPQDVQEPQVSWQCIPAPAALPSPPSTIPVEQTKSNGLAFLAILTWACWKRNNFGVSNDMYSAIHPVIRKVLKMMIRGIPPAATVL